MKRSSSKRNLAVFTAIAAISVGSLGGCELLVDFDRTLIDAGSLGEVDGSGFDATSDDGSSSEASTDAGNDSGDSATTPDASDASSDASDDAPDGDM